MKNKTPRIAPERAKRISIKTKIMYALLFISLLSLVISSATNLLSLSVTKEYVVESNTEQGSVIAGLSSDAMLDLSVTNVIGFAEVKADALNLELKKVSDSLGMLAGYAGELYRNPDKYSRVEYSHPLKSREGELCMQWVLADNVRLEDVSDEIYLQGNMKPLFDSVMKSEPNICSVYITTATGANTGYDAYPQEKPMNFDGRVSDWYVNAKESGGLYISNAYYDSFGRGLCISMAMPIYGKADHFVGVIALDILISDLNDNILQTVVGETGYAMLFANDKSIVAAPDFSEGDDMRSLEKFLGSDWDSIYSSISSGGSGFTEGKINDSDVYIIYAQIELTDWIIAIVLPKSDITSGAETLKTAIEADTEELAGSINRVIINVTLLIVALFAVMLGVVVFLGKRLAGKISRPIVMLNSDIKCIGNGNFDYSSKIKTGDEIEELSESFESMTEELKKYIQNLAAASAYKERIATELAVATQIQSSMLPCVFPAFPDKTEFDIYATMTPAKEVGGDFYDFFAVDDNHLAVVMADVSGKGVPAALFMMTAKTRIKDSVMMGKTPAEAFTAANNALSENNDAFMFVTAFMGILELSTGILTCVNAGHNPPLLRRHTGWEWLKLKPGCVLALMPEMEYTQEEVQLEPQDILFTYTDGVTEALDNDKALYGEERLIERLGSADAGNELKPLLEYISEDIRLYADGAEQADDITMLALKYTDIHNKPENQNK